MFRLEILLVIWLLYFNPFNVIVIKGLHFTINLLNCPCPSFQFFIFVQRFFCGFICFEAAFCSWSEKAISGIAILCCQNTLLCYLFPQRLHHSRIPKFPCDSLSSWNIRECYILMRRMRSLLNHQSILSRLRHQSLKLLFVVNHWFLIELESNNSYSINLWSLIVLPITKYWFIHSSLIRDFVINQWILFASSMVESWLSHQFIYYWKKYL